MQDVGAQGGPRAAEEIEEARKLLHESLEGRREKLGEWHAHTLQSKDNLGRLELEHGCQVKALALVVLQRREPHRDELNVDRGERLSREHVLRRRNPVAQQLEAMAGVVQQRYSMAEMQRSVAEAIAQFDSQA